jgi:SPP1 gp7 family putative phage head morphogenesis protein
MTIADSFLIDASARHAVFLQRFAGGLSGEVQQILDEMRQDIERIFAGEPTDLRGDRVAAVLGRAQSTIELRLNSLSQRVIEQITELAASEAAFSVNMLTEASTVPAVAVPIASVMAGVLRTGMDTPIGPAQLTIAEALAAFSRAKSREIRQTIADMVGQGATLPEISRAVSDLINTRQKRHADTLTRTIVNHTSSRARHAALEENAGLLEGYEWVAVLDLRTTLICGGRDGMTYRVGRGPLPPAHWNCRSTIAPVVADEFQKKRLPGFKKPTGKITPETTYGEWLKQQTAGFQDEALGPTRAKLFREGGLTVDRFRNETGVTYTLLRLQELEPLAFDRARVDAVGARLVPRAGATGA